jgi:hypothetical protein
MKNEYLKELALKSYTYFGRLKKSSKASIQGILANRLFFLGFDLSLHPI